MSQDKNIKKLEELIRDKCLISDQHRLQKKFKEQLKNRFADPDRQICF